MQGHSNTPLPCTSEIIAGTVCRFLFCRQAFDRNGNGALDVADLEDLLKMLKGINGASTPVGGVKAAMKAMDEDHSGQVAVACHRYLE